MKNYIKKVLTNELIVFILFFVMIFIYLAVQDYDYYKVYDKEALMEFFSMKDTLLYNLGQTVRASISQLIISMPLLAILEKTKMKKILKILITLVLTFIISFIVIMFVWTLQ